MTRVANRTHTDNLVLELLELAADEWLHLDDLGTWAYGAAEHLALEYDAVQLLPVSRCCRLVATNLVRYETHDRNYHPARLGENER
jgi:hypothetical protein